jgi:1-acyl-sn-glycerol-3-phosphate acyltransferase
MRLFRLLFLTLAWVALHMQLLLLGVVSLAWNGVAALLYPVLPRATGRKLGRFVIATGYAAFWRVARCSGMLKIESEALAALRDESGIIIAANHPSMLDAVMLVARLPKSACVMKASLLRNPLLGPGARLARYIRNDSPRTMVARAVADLQQGGQLVLFPEGTRSPPRSAAPAMGASAGPSQGGVPGAIPSGPFGPFGAAFTLIAKHAQAPIQTVFIDTTSPYLGKGWPLWRLPPLPMVFTVRLGARFAPSSDHIKLQQEIEAYFHTQVAPKAITAPSTYPAAMLMP